MPAEIARPVERRFFFHANAVALAAHIRRPEDFFVPAVASSCLPVTGGLAQADAPGQSFNGLISFGSASTHAKGDFVDQRTAAEYTRGNHGDNNLPTSTIVESSMKSLKINTPADPAGGAGRVFSIDNLVVRMENTSDRRSPTSFRSLYVTIDGVSVDGHLLLVKTNPEIFTENDTKKKLEERFEDDSDFRKQFGQQFFYPGEPPEHGALEKLFSKHKIPEADDLIYGTIVTSMTWASTAPDGAGIAGNELKIPGLGSIYFGEIIIEEDFRRITLIRFQLGSPNGGDGAVCEAQSNGGTWPPQRGGL
ncbi:MAG: hypothetical protein JO033_13685 [Acidobacteriaceae bacterium]|nr:hypothetical protein [Acidobacteriaceae bacterium]MBV9501839.1 hypothetical protein [Acidobacteriaceae bacterium]